MISESSRRLMREICPQGMSKEDCNEGVGETGGAAWSLEVLGLELLEHFLVLRTSECRPQQTASLLQ